MHRILPISAALLACALQAAEGTLVTVTNGDFESGAKGWENGPKLTSEQKHGGGKALALAKGFVFQSPASMIPVESGSAYQIRLWVKTDGCKPQAAGICAGFRSADGKNLIGGWIEGAQPVYAMDKGQSPVLAVFGGTSDWTEVVIGIPAQQVPAAAKFLHVYLRHDLVKDPGGTVFIDDLTVRKLPAGAVPAGMILKNGGFEQGKTGWWGQGTWSVVNEGAAEGSGALRIDKGFACQDKRTVVGGQRYKISMRIRSDAAPEGSVYAQLSYRGPDVGQGWHGPITVESSDKALFATGGTHDWKTFSVVVQAPAQADQILIYLRKAGDDGGAGFFDAVSVEPTDEPLTPSQAMIHGGPIIINGDFEKSKRPWWGQGTWEIVPGQGTAGSAALRLESGFACQDKRPVEERKNYRISMRVRSEGCADNAIYVQTSYRNVDDKPIGSWQGPLRWKNEAAVVVTGGTHDWKDVSIVVQAPPAAAQVLLYLRKQAGEGAAWFDDVRIEATDEKPFTVADRRAAELAAELLLPAPAGGDATALAAAVGLGAAAVPARHVLAEAGKPAIRLHVAGGGDVTVLGAAKELATYLQQITGADFTGISHDAQAQAGPLLVLGRDSALTAKLCADVDWDKLGPDGFIIRSAGAHLIIAGATPRGTMYGVYWFLDRQLGVRWLSPTYTHVPSVSALALGKQDVRQVPRFAYREVLSHEGSDAWFAARNLMNGRSHGPSYSPTAPEIDNWDHHWMAAGISSDFWDLLNKKETEKTHPEWFTGGQVAMMDKGMRAAMAQGVIDRLKALPDYTQVWYNIWQKDWGWDMDPASKAFAAKHGGRASAPRLDMMIDIAEQVRAVLPGAKFSMQAYNWGFTPPEGMTVPDHILIFPMTIHVDYSTPLNVGRNEKLGADMVAWTKIAKNVMIWDHIANWAGFIQPTPNIFPIGDSLRWLAAEPSFQGYFCEGNWNSAGGELGALRAWLIARMTWDPQQEPRTLVDEWCSLHFGKAGPQVRRYIDLMHEAAAKSGDILGQRYTPDLPMYSVEFVSAADALFDQAEAAVAGDAGALGRVRHARMPIDHLILLRRSEYAAVATQRGLPWNADIAARRARFDQAVIDNKIRQYLQGGKIEALQETLNIERSVAKADPKVADLSPTDWVDIQDLSFMRFSSAVIVPDPAASDGAAIRMVGKSSTWAMQLQVERLPKEGSWDLYAAVRTECEPGHDDEPAVRVGSSPPMGLFNTGTAKELSDGSYHLIKVPGGPHTWRDDARLHSIYLQSPAKPWITWIYLDRIIAIRAKGK